MLLSFATIIQISGEKSEPFWSMRLGRVTKRYTPLSPPLSKDEGLSGIGHSMSIGNLILGTNGLTVSYLIHYDSLLQNATAILLQNARKFITKCIRSFVTKYDSFVCGKRIPSSLFIKPFEVPNEA